jgi:hypothetical protein
MIAQKLIDAAQECTDGFNTAAGLEAFKQLAQEVENVVVYAESTAEMGRRRESLWRELATEYNHYIPPTIKIIELRKELGLE